MTTVSRRTQWPVVLPVALATAVAEVVVEPYVAGASDEPFTLGYIFLAGGLLGLLLVALPPKGVRRPIGVGLLIGTAVAFLVLLVLIFNELNNLGTTGV